MKTIHKNISILGLVAMSTSSYASTIIFQDDFTTDSTPPDQHRLYESRIDTGWNATTGYGTPNTPSEWDITGGQLVNPTAIAPPAGSAYTGSESPVWNWFTNSATSTTDTLINISLDYNVGAGDTLHIHFWAVESGGAAGANNFIGNNQAWINGNSGQNATSSLGGFTPYNLSDGSNAPTTGSLSGALTGTGTYNATIDISALGITGISDVGDIDQFLFAVAMNEAGGGATSIDNLSITTVVPEPSSTALLGLGGLALLARRKRG